ncbi:MAG: Mu transposase C-terminal domain-containing protein [Chloroflexota bacterium]|nr:Mu transposase C-terminal domain-containing protein [Chloroflexota bacterium]
MVALEVQGIDLFKIANRSISGWVPSFKMGSAAAPVKLPFCSQLEEHLLLWLEYHPLVVNYARGDIDAQFATKYRLPIPQHAPFTIGYTFEDQFHHYLPDAVGMLSNGRPFIAEAGMEDDKRGDRNLAKAEAARRLARLQEGVFWIGTERTLTKRRSFNLVFLHARRKTFPAFADIATSLASVWPWGEVASIEEVASRLSHQFPVDLVEAAIWKVVADAAAAGHLLLDLEQFTLSRTLPLALLSPDAPVVVPSPLPDTLEPPPDIQPMAGVSRVPVALVAGPTFDASRLAEPQQEQFHRNLRAVEQVLAGAKQTQVARDAGIPRPTLSRLVKRTKLLGSIACVPYGSYTRKTTMHPAFQECIRRLYLLPTRLTMTAIREHSEMQQVATRLTSETGKPVKLPSYAQVRKEVQSLSVEPALVAMREGAKSVPRERESPQSFALSIPAPALLTQVDEHTMDLYVVTPSGETVASRVHAAVLICVKTAAILGAILALGPLKEEDYMRLVKVSLERKDHLVGITGCEHAWPCFGKPAIIFHDRGKIFTSERARSVLVDRLGIITEQAPPYAPSAKGTVENLFRWMTERFEKRLSNSSYGVHDAEAAAQAGGMTLEALERCFYQAIVDDYQQAFNDLRRQRPSVLWELGVAQSGVPQYLGSPDDLKLLLMKAQNRKTPHHGYRVQSGNRLSFQGRWYVCPGLLSRLRGREFDLYYDRRDVGVLYIFVEGEYVGEAYCPQLMGGRVSEWEARAMRKHDEEQARIAREQGLSVRARIQNEAGTARRSLRAEIRQVEQARQWDRQRGDIHPAIVSEHLAILEAEKLAPPKLAPARPDAEPDRPVRILPVRRM